MIFKKYKRGGFLIKEWDASNVSYDHDYVTKRIERITSLVIPFTPTLLQLWGENGIYSSQETIIKKESLSNLSIASNLNILAEQLDNIHEEDLVHGDIKYANIIFHSNRLMLIDWEPILVYTQANRTHFRSTMPYIASSDLEEKKITKLTDKIGFYFTCKGLLEVWRPYKRADAIGIENHIKNLNCKEICKLFT